MARRVFAAGSVTNATGAPLRLVFYTTQTGTLPEKDLWTVDGSYYPSAAIPNGIILTDSSGAYSSFAGPDDIDSVWIAPSNGAARTQITATRAVASAPTADTTAATLAADSAFTGTYAAKTANQRYGYDAPGTGGTADWGLTGSLSVNGAAGDHRIWNSAPGKNVLSIRNAADPTTNDNDSAIRFLDASSGIERLAVGYHNGTHNGDIFPGAAFVETSSQINLDATLDLTRPTVPLRIVQTGVPTGGSYGAYVRMDFATNGDVTICSLATAMSAMTPYLKVAGSDGTTTIYQKLGIGPNISTLAAGTLLHLRKDANTTIEGIIENQTSGGFMSLNFLGTSGTSRGKIFAAANAAGLNFRPGGGNDMVLDGSGNLKVAGSMGFNGTTPVAKPTITGSRSANAALASLLTALAATGILTDSSSA